MRCGGRGAPPAASPVVDVDPPVAERVGPPPSQTVNAKYKVSYEKLVTRLGVTWRNAVRLVVLHEVLFGPGRLTFASIDEKP